MSDSYRVYRTIDDVKAEVIERMKDVGINWEAVDDLSIDDLEDILKFTERRMDMFERGYTILTNTNDASIGYVCDVVMQEFQGLLASSINIRQIIEIKKVITV